MSSVHSQRKGAGLRPPPQRGAAFGRPPFVVSCVFSLSKAHILALNTAHVLRLNKADVLALNKAHVLRLNKADVLALSKAHVLRLNNKILCFSTTLKFARNLLVKRKATHVNAEALGVQEVTKLERGGHFAQLKIIDASIWSKLFFSG